MERAAGLAHDDTHIAELDKLMGLFAQTSTPIEDAALFAEMLSLPMKDAIPRSTWRRSSADRKNT